MEEEKIKAEDKGEERVGAASSGNGLDVEIVTRLWSCG